jgi:hypothetical protein
MLCRRKILRVDRRQIGFMRFIFEAYDGIANLTTIDAAKGIISVNVPDGCMQYVDTLLESLAGDIHFEPYNERDLR